MAVNVILPFSFAWAQTNLQPQLKEQSFLLYYSYPRLGKNWIIRHMEKQIGVSPKLGSSTLRQQGLIHLYKNFCTAGGCELCPLGE